MEWLAALKAFVSLVVEELWKRALHPILQFILALWKRASTIVRVAILLALLVGLSLLLSKSVRTLVRHPIAGARVIFSGRTALPISAQSVNSGRRAATILRDAIGPGLAILKLPNAWATGQALVAMEPHTGVAAKEVDQYFRSTRQPNATLWAEVRIQSRPAHMVASAWVLWASVLSGEVDVASLRAFEGQQYMDANEPWTHGAWPMFTNTFRDPRAANTYATAMALIVLCQWRDSAAYDSTSRQNLGTRLASASEWLTLTMDIESGRWRDYPNGSGESKWSEPLTATAIYGLHRAGLRETSRMDRLWLRSIAHRQFVPWDHDQSERGLKLQDGTFETDHSRHYLFPWALLATVVAYPSGSFAERVNATVTVDSWLGGLDDKMTRATIEQGIWIGAEILCALRLAGIASEK